MSSVNLKVVETGESGHFVPQTKQYPARVLIVTRCDVNHTEQPQGTTFVCSSVDLMGDVNRRNSCMTQQFCLVKSLPSIRAVRTAQNSDRPEPNDVEHGYRTLRCIQRCSPEADRHTHTGVQVLSLVSQRSSRRLHVPAISFAAHTALNSLTTQRLLK